MQSVPITTNIRTPLTDQMYLIQHYVMKLVNNLQQVSGFLQPIRFPPQTKLTATI